MRIAPINRRAFLRGAAGLAAGLPLWGRRAFAVGDQAGLIARRVFFENPEYRNVQISPDGRQLAYLAPLDGVRNLWIAPLDAPQSGRAVTHATDRDLGSEYRWAHTNRHLVFSRDHDGDENWRIASVDLETGAIMPLSPERGVRALIQESDHKFPSEMLLRHNQRDPHFFDLFRVNLTTGESRLIYENGQYYGLITDSAFRLRLAERVIQDGGIEVFEFRPDGSLAPFLTIPLGDVDGTELLDFSADGGTLYLLDSRGRDKAVFAALDMATRQTTVLAEDDEADIVRVAFADRVPLAAMAMTGRVRWHSVAPGSARDLTALAAYGAGDAYLLNLDQPALQVVAYFERDRASGEYVTLDRDAATVKRLYIQHKVLDEVPLRALEPVNFAARDGLRLNGYLTHPAIEPGSGKPPLVLVIHGGPYLRDQWGFNPTHQWIASRGYAALSINYRGSTGFGKAFVTAADGEWGGRMHDDLIDGLDWAIGQGFADPNRIGFFGASYGGYSALMAATKTPERFACIVDLFGISNLLTFMATIPPYWTPWFRVWKNRLGDPDTEAGRAFLAERSPLNHLERATRPILIAQGLQDVRVVPAESEQMVAALSRQGVLVTYATFADEGHGFVRPENRLAFYAVAEAFLAKHLGGTVQPVGDDFAGSSIAIPTGRDLIPGLPA